MSTSTKSKPKKAAADTKSAPAKPAGQPDTSIEQLHILIKNAQVQLEDIQKQKNQVNHEKVVLTNMCTIAAQNSTTLEQNSYVLSNEIDTVYNTHKAYMDTYKNKVVHMKYEHKNNHTDTDTSVDTRITQLASAFTITQAEFEAVKQQLLGQIQSDSERFNAEIHKLKELEAKELVKLTENFESNYAAQRDMYAANLQQIEQSYNLYNRIKLHEINERKNLHINNLIQQQNQSIDNIKQYYKSITTDNLQLIKQLNTQLNQCKQQYADNQKLIEQVTHENNVNSVPLQQSVNTVNTLRAKLANYDKNKMNLKINKNRLVQLKQQYSGNEKKYAELLVEFERVESERDALVSNFTTSIESIQHMSSGKNVALEERVNTLENEFEGKKVQFQQILKVANLDKSVLNDVTNKLDYLLNDKNDVLKHLRYELMKVEKNNANMVEQYDAKLKQHGIDSDNHNVESDQSAKTQKQMQQLAV